MSDKFTLTRDMLVHHITVNGKPYCQVEADGVTFKLIPFTRYPTNCGHGNKADAEEGVAACKEQRPDLTYGVVEGPCHSDPWWQTQEGRDAIELEFELDEMRRQ